MEQLQALYKERAARKPQPAELDSRVALEAFLLSLRSFPKAATSPYTLDKFTKAAVPILGLCACIAALGQVVLLPLTILSWLASLVMRRNGRAVRQSMHSGLLGSIGMLSVMAMTVMRQVLHKPIFKVFIHTLRDVNPALAQQLETSRPLPASPAPASAARQQQRQRTQRLPGPAWLWQNRLLRAVALSLLTRYWRSLPVARHFAAPVMLFLPAERLLGTTRAAMIGGLALWPPVAPWIVAGLDLWRTSHFLAPELLSDYIAHRIPGPLREEFLRTNKVAIFCYTFPQLLLFNIPVIGPLLFLPASAAAAYLSSYLDSLPKNKQFQVGAGAQPSAAKMH